MDRAKVFYWRLGDFISVKIVTIKNILYNMLYNIFFFTDSILVLWWTPTV